MRTLTFPLTPLPPSEFRIDKERTLATITLSNGATVHGCMFLSPGNQTHSGPERVKDVLNSETGFFPFEVSEEDGVRTVLYHRDHVLVVALTNARESRQDPGYEVATTRGVSMLLSNGTRLAGHVRVFSPRGRDRLSDYARMAEQFRYLETSEGTVIVNTRHVVELSEASGS